jgi:indole-3-glycerol phosphate synthase
MTSQSAPDILKQIVAVKAEEVERLKREVPVAELERLAADQPAPLNMVGALTGASIRVIAEIKKRSPTKGDLRPDMDVAELASVYSSNGAAAISVLTNADHFGGRIGDLATVAKVAHATGVPVLRKEFMFDPYQVIEARAHGADAILLIVAMLDPDELASLKQQAESLWMQVLVEVHDAAELEVALEIGAEIVGINNRDLRTFVTDLSTTEALAPSIPPGKVIVGESGIHGRADIDRIAAAGAHAALIGESLVVAPDPGTALRDLIS